MNFYLYSLRVFDRSPNPNLEVFPHMMQCATIAKNEIEAQRSIVDDLYERDGFLEKYSTDEDPADRFSIIFNREADVVREVYWDDELNTWNWADEEVPPEVRATQLEWAHKQLMGLKYNIQC